MPTYEYKCPNGHLFEKTFPRITSKRFATCPTCGKRAERQISGGAGLVFKGSGFYATDYKRPAGTTEKADKTAEKAEKAETPADSKPKKKDSSSDK
ncbi:MAG TPA: FmdB family zinc ribbon protein [Gemmatimonadales bacterium]